MELTVKKRDASKKSETKRVRRAGHIPAVIYGLHREPEAIEVDGVQFAAHLRQVTKGQLSTSVFVLKGDGFNGKVLVKDIQYHPTTYEIIHLDFEEMKSDVAINVNVPIEFTGVADCSGIKLGGVLRQVIRALRVRCKPEHLPSHFSLDVRHLAMRQSMRLRDIKMPAGVRPLGKMDEVVVVIAKR
jgi:large subunit ribosomal protein L25